MAAGEDRRGRGVGFLRMEESAREVEVESKSRRVELKVGGLWQSELRHWKVVESRGELRERVFCVCKKW